MEPEEVEVPEVTEGTVEREALLETVATTEVREGWAQMEEREDQE
jgi:hypothetical protein